MKNILLVDFGGTNMRYAFSESGSSKINNIVKSSFKSINEFEDQLEDLISSNNIKILIISIAGPKINNEVTMTNRDYVFNSENFKEKYNLNECHLLNDWEAIAHSYDFVADSIKTIKDGNKFNNNTLFVGPGTGLGVSFLIDNMLVSPTEVGNTSNSLSYLSKNFSFDINQNITLEEIVSGNGIANLFKIKTNKDISSEEVFKMYDDNDLDAQEIVTGFTKSFANILSDLALTFMPGNGILLAGSLSRTLFNILDKELFISHFYENKKATHKDVLKMISIGVIFKEQSPLYGNLNFYNKLKNK